MRVLAPLLVLALVTAMLPARAEILCRPEMVEMYAAHDASSMETYETSSARSYEDNRFVSVLVCRSGSYTSHDGGHPPTTGDYLDVVENRVTRFNASDDSYTSGEVAPPPERTSEQTGRCRYAGDWRSGGAYTYGRCLSLRVENDLTFSYRMSAREVKGQVLTGVVQFTFKRADGEPTGPVIEAAGTTCPVDTRGGANIANCDRAPTGSLSRADIPADATQYCGIGRVYQTVSGQKSEAEPPIFAPCFPVPAV